MIRLIDVSLLLAINLVYIVAQSTVTPVRVSTGDPNAYPVPAPEAKLCLQALNHSGVLDRCHNQALSLWNPAERGESVSTILDFCCSIYEETDCLINATTNGKYCTNDNGEQEAYVNHMRTVFGWWKRNDCQTVSYHTGQCDPDQKQVFPPPQPKLVAQCSKKIYTKINHCEDQAKGDWNAKPTDTFFSQSRCCSQYQINDCLVNSAKQMCTSDEFTQFHLYYYNLDMNISSINCTAYQYQSVGCLTKNSVQGPLANSCSQKIVKEFRQCFDTVGYEWTINTGGDITSLLGTGHDQCCASWDFFDCINRAAKDKCTLRELSQFEQYFNVVSQQMINVNCTQFPYHSSQCQGKNPKPEKEADSCLTKISSKSCESEFTGKKWHITGQGKGNASMSDACCSQLEISKCLQTRAMTKCTSNELSSLNNYLSQKINGQCGQNGLGLDHCGTGGAATLSATAVTLLSWLVVGSIYLLI